MHLLVELYNRIITNYQTYCWPFPLLTLVDLISLKNTTLPTHPWPIKYIGTGGHGELEVVQMQWIRPKPECVYVCMRVTPVRGLQAINGVFDYLHSSRLIKSGFICPLFVHFWKLLLVWHQHHVKNLQHPDKLQILTSILITLHQMRCHIPPKRHQLNWYSFFIQSKNVRNFFYHSDGSETERDLGCGPPNRLRM